MERAKKLLSRSYASLSNVGVLISGAGALAITVMTTYEVVSRYVFNAPTSWSVQLSRYVLIVCLFWGGAYALNVERHVRVELLLRRLSERKRNVLLLAGYMLGLVFASVLVYETAVMTLKAYERGWVSEEAVTLPLAPLFALIPAAGLLLMAGCILKICRQIRLLRSTSAEN